MNDDPLSWFKFEMDALEQTLRLIQYDGTLVHKNKVNVKGTLIKYDAK